MIFDPNQTRFDNEPQHEIWQHGIHLVPLSVSLADVVDEQIREGCRQVYDCTMEILEDMYEHAEAFSVYPPKWYASAYLEWAVTGQRPMKKHSDEYARFLEKLSAHGFTYDQSQGLWTNRRYPLLGETLAPFKALAKKRKQNLGGYFERLDFRLFAPRIQLTDADLLRPLSDKNRAYALDMQQHALSLGMKVERTPYCFRYSYKKLYSLELLNHPFGIRVIYRLDNGKHVRDQLERFLSVAEEQADADEMIRYIHGGIMVCDSCAGKKRPDERCGQWKQIHGARRLVSMCHPAVGKYRRGVQNTDFLDSDIQMLKRLLDVRVEQVDQYLLDRAE